MSCAITGLKDTVIKQAARTAQIGVKMRRIVFLQIAGVLAAGGSDGTVPNNGIITGLPPPRVSLRVGR
jgi:hypothetical protein